MLRAALQTVAWLTTRLTVDLAGPEPGQDGWHGAGERDSFRRDDSGGIHEAQRPEQLREGVLGNLRSLQLDQVPVVNLRRHPEAGMPFDE
jgi:hypothetical protein